MNIPKHSQKYGTLWVILEKSEHSGTCSSVQNNSRKYGAFWYVLVNTQILQTQIISNNLKHSKLVLKSILEQSCKLSFRIGPKI